MKPIISISEEQIHIDDEHYTLFIRFKKQPETHQVIKTEEYPDEIIAIRGNDPPKDNPKRKDLKERKCVMCETEFKPYRFDSNCCSKKCRAAYKNKKHRSKNPKPSSLRGKPAKVEIKVCQHCHKEYKPTSNVQKFCSLLCKFSFRQGAPKPKVETTRPEKKQKLNNPKAAIRDKNELRAEKLRRKALEQSPKIDELIPVFIDAKTTIYIKPLFT